MARSIHRDPARSAVVTGQRPLYYAAGADPALDRPDHVRAGSSLAWVPGGIAVLQDDANFLAIVDPDDASVRSITLPAGKHGVRQFDDGRGNKKAKLDLEACVAVRQGDEQLLLAFGSGSTKHRERILKVGRLGQVRPAVDLVQCDRLYDLLRQAPAFAPTRLNIEGVAALGRHLRLFSRGNGKVRDGVAPANATCDVDLETLLSFLDAPERAPLPRPARVVEYDLGLLGGVPLSFTDADRWQDGVLFTAAAEASPDALRDGAVTGSAIGMIDGAGRGGWAALTLPSGAPFTSKVEGMVTTKEEGHLYVVVDADDPEVASLLCTVVLRGF